eukprot:tig00000711_g3369.t1
MDFDPPLAVLYPYDRVRALVSTPVVDVGVGLANLGATCYANASLQALLHTRALTNWLRGDCERGHSGCSREWCPVCELIKLSKLSLGSRASSLSPTGLMHNLPKLAKTLKLGRQEDAQEFLRALLDALARDGEPMGARKLPMRVSETSAVHRIFGGVLESRVACLECRRVSRTWEAALDLSLEVSDDRISSVSEALRHFMAPELLDESHGLYTCEKCEKRVRSRKSYAVFRPPEVLTLHLKRFSFDPEAMRRRGASPLHIMLAASGGVKVSRHVAFEEELDLAPFLVPSHHRPARYQLYAVVVHEGPSVQAGHYYAYVRPEGGARWLCFDDARVSEAPVERVLASCAYLLFYRRLHAAPALVPRGLGAAPAFEWGPLGAAGSWLRVELPGVARAGEVEAYLEAWAGPGGHEAAALLVAAGDAADEPEAEFRPAGPGRPPELRITLRSHRPAPAPIRSPADVAPPCPAGPSSPQRPRQRPLPASPPKRPAAAPAPPAPPCAPGVDASPAPSPAAPAPAPPPPPPPPAPRAPRRMRISEV